jgi:hypothetical protein
MSKQQESLVLSSCLGDILSERFRPPCDKEHREHTLGRLATNAAIKGFILYEDVEALLFSGAFATDLNNLVMQKYSPSWAPFADVRTIRTKKLLSSDTTSNDISQILGLHIHRPDHKNLWVVDRTTEISSPDLQYFTESEGVKTVESIQVSDFDKIRREIGSAAFAFFNNTEA